MDEEKERLKTTNRELFLENTQLKEKNLELERIVNMYRKRVNDVIEENSSYLRAYRSRHMNALR